MQLKISTMTGKLEGLYSINSNPLSNEFCKRMALNKDIICNQCYSNRMLQTYRKSCVLPFEVNSQLLSKSFIKVPRIKDRFFRFNSHGELINSLHLFNLYRIAIKNSQTTFTLWSKRIGIVSRFFKKHKKPDNLILIYSNPFIDKKVKKPKVFDKVFNVKTKDIDINCGNKKCLACLYCYQRDNGIDVINEKIK